VLCVCVCVCRPDRRSSAAAGGSDADDSDIDLPRDYDMTLTATVVDACVLASVDTPDRPAFHLPLRSGLDVRLVSYLDRRDSPLLCADRQNPHASRPRLSTMDRCVEPLDEQTAADLLTNCQRDGSVPVGSFFIYLFIYLTR